MNLLQTKKCASTPALLKNGGFGCQDNEDSVLISERVEDEEGDIIENISWVSQEHKYTGKSQDKDGSHLLNSSHDDDIRSDETRETLKLVLSNMVDEIWEDETNKE